MGDDAKRTDELLGELERIVRGRAEAGVVSPAEVIRARLDVYNARQQAKHARSLLWASWALVVATIGLIVATVLPVLM
jgi:outer membrane protein TolC